MPIKDTSIPIGVINNATDINVNPEFGYIRKINNIVTRKKTCR